MLDKTVSNFYKINKKMNELIIKQFFAFLVCKSTYSISWFWNGFGDSFLGFRGTFTNPIQMKLIPNCRQNSTCSNSINYYLAFIITNIDYAQCKQKKLKINFMMTIKIYI